MPTAWQSALDDAIDARFEQMVQLRRHLHQNPELSGSEQQTTLHIYQLLLEEAIAVRMGPEGRGIVADLPNAENQTRVALRADIDALPIDDGKVGCEYRSQVDGVMHACGHDGHTATTFGAVTGIVDAIAANHIPAIPLRAIFQPAEETCTGAAEMIEFGALEGVGAIFALHMDPTRRLGTVGLKPNVLTAHCDEIRFTVHGRGGHAARPHETIDSIAAAAYLVSALYQLIPRVTDSQDAVVVSIGQIRGGENANVIPESVHLRGTVRSLCKEVRDETFEHIRRIAKGVETTTGSRIEVEFGVGAEAVVNDPYLTKLLTRSARNLLGPDKVQNIPRPSMGSEDFAFYLAHVPGAMMRLGCVSDAVGGPLLHAPNFDLDEESMRIGAKILARSAVHWALEQDDQHSKEGN
jgi:amidohydrolase